MTKFHPTAIVDKGGNIHESVEIGPFSMVEKAFRSVVAASKAHVRIYSGTIMGCNNRVCHGAMLGCEPQDLFFCGQEQTAYDR